MTLDANNEGNNFNRTGRIVTTRLIQYRRDLNGKKYW